ncbi:MAG: hypothetical protein DRQ02_06660 [Candidatus Latescibacterota bacterium]|nr:MAG: hypothetical protein DRQ02_06660 [Candidatus Latescibacterota bacterium]RKY70463.1 MAG: hypothetical protein DRQ24_09230 [Candidatus Latescibacterota bacterium]
MDLFHFNPDSEKTPLKVVPSLAQILLKKAISQKRDPILPSKQIVGGVCRRRRNRALESPPTEIDIRKVSP